MYIYVQLNSDNIVVGVSQLARSVDLTNMIEVAEFDESYIGKRWTGSTWENAPTPPPEELLAQWRETADCSRLQAMLVLDEAGLLDQIEEWIASRSAPKSAKLAWKEAYRFSRKSPLWRQFAHLFGLSEEQIDDLFRRAVLKEV